MQKHILTLIFLFTGVFVQAQNTAKSVPKWKYYVDCGLGFIPDEVGFIGSASISAGVTKDKRYGLGLALSGISNTTRNATGVGLELRLTPIRWLLLKGQVGGLFDVTDYDESGPAIYTYLPKESSPIFWRGTFAVRFARILFAGVVLMRTNDVVFAYRNAYPPNTTGKYTSNLKTTVWQLGMSLPVLPKKKKENQ
jgi:hypothetical protein